ncbi:MAG: heparan-alpha-glucosaminide N-acetyltransferase domain-containing protein [Pseudomonadota bacterium]
MNRWLSLDVFRGITIALMIVVNSPGMLMAGHVNTYSWLQHSVWNGCTLADLVFPFFVFIIGVSLVFSLSKSLALGVSRNQLALKVLKRSLIIFSIGLLLNAIPDHFNYSTLRVFGVLQRLAICYYVAAMLFLSTSTRSQVLLTISLLVGYWFMLTMFPVPGYGINNLSQEGNLPAYIDRMLFSSAHLYGKIFDPEGALSTLPAIATTLLGNLTGIWLMTNGNHQKKLTGIMIAAPLALITGWVWGLWFPINKALWTSSYVLVTGGLALLLLSLCIWLIEIRQWKYWARPFEIFGMNAIAAYVLHIVLLRIQAKIYLPRIDGSPGNLRIYIAEHLFGWTSAQNASLLYALSYASFLLIIFAVLYRHKIFIKI